MIRLCLAAIMTFAPFAAQALSCLPHSVEAAYLQAEEAEAQFLIVHGTLEFDQAALPKVDWDNQDATPALTEIPAEFSGMALANGEFHVPFVHEVVLRVECIGPWCASAQKGVDTLAFVELREEDPHVISTNPCGGYLFGSPKPKMIRAVKDCAAGKDCVPLR